MAFLKALNAGCQFPVASFAEFVDGTSNLKIHGIYWDESSQRLLKAEIIQSVDYNAADAIRLARSAGYALADKIKVQL